MANTKELFESFKTNLEGVSGECYHATKADVSQMIAGLYKDAGVTTASVFESDFIKEIGLVDALKGAGVEVHTDHIRKYAETDQGGISEAQYGIAELGSLIQAQQDVDGRIVATMSEYYIGILKESAILDTYDDAFDMLDKLDPLPGFVGFITGPSRTADIECVGTVGVHGPLRMAAVIVQDA